MGNFLEMWEAMGLLAKAVVVVMVIMSIWSISVMIERYLTYRAARNQSKAFAPAISEALKRGNMQEAINLCEAEEHKKSHLARVLVAGLQEYSTHQSASDETIEASRRALDRAQAVHVENLKRGLGGLATVGATAPFVGLFGTTVGIINAFAGMTAGETTGLGAVAGGISEALVTTAFGLFVAVPAVWMFNYFTSRIESFVVEMDNSSSELIDYFVTRRAK
jgi:biopolymer transport protein ExbB/biopolymer transport protein TolQ